MPILTLTTDFGTNNFYLASFKGLIFRGLDTVQIVDISHNTSVFDLQTAAFQVQYSWKNFPKNTLHFVRVGEQYAPRQRFIACRHQEQFFVLPDNGLITLITGEDPEQVVALESPALPTDLSQSLAKVIVEILRSHSMDHIGQVTNQYVERYYPQPISNNNIIRGVIQYIDRYGNLISNVTQEFFESQRRNRRFEIITRAIQIDQIDLTYSDVPPSEKVSLFNSMGLLQLSINEGNAAQLLGLDLGDQIQIEFYD